MNAHAPTRPAAAATALGPLLITERTIAQTRTLYVNSWGGSFTAAQEAAYFKPFTALTGIHIAASAADICKCPAWADWTRRFNISGRGSTVPAKQN